MSNSQLESNEERMEVVKKEKREKSEKKKSKSNDKVDDLAVDEPESKKRKRETLPDEIEIDVNLPEPASKKAARKAKKAKIEPALAAEAKPNVEKAENTDAKEHSGKRSEYGVWIGNLPWSATKDSLRAFLTENAEIKTEEITRVHMPAPTTAPRPNWHSEKPQNKGFAYVDFHTQLAMYSAIALTETKMDGRALLIKNARNFEGRPDKPVEQQETDGKKGKEEKKPSRKVFVGNLGFETSKEDLEAHFGQCGTVEDIHMATFEDSGKCKGFAWVTFGDVEAATAAVKGYVYKSEEAAKRRKNRDNGEDDEQGAHGKDKKRKYKLNKLMGRDLRCEFAEDSTTRYQKRFGKEKKGEDADGIVEVSGGERPQKGKKTFGQSSKQQRPRGKVDPRTIRPGAAHANAPRASAAIVASEGKKITFD